MDRDEKKVDECLESLITKCSDLKSSIGSFLVKMENSQESGGVNWPSALDSYAQISGQMNSVIRLLNSQQSKTSDTSLKNLILLPIFLSPDPDEGLTALTEGRVNCFNHDMVPAYLRTKLEPEIESQERAVAAKAGSMSQDQGSKAVNLVNKIVTHVTESVKGWREEWESGSESSLRASLVSHTSSAADTNAIISAITFGKGVKSGPVVPAVQPDSSSKQQSQPQPQMQPKAGKVPTVRTNIKTAVHPYNSGGGGSSK